jgi:hypothetical protein
MAGLAVEAAQVLLAVQEIHHLQAHLKAITAATQILRQLTITVLVVVGLEVQGEMFLDRQEVLAGMG